MIHKKIKLPTDIIFIITASINCSLLHMSRRTPMVFLSRTHSICRLKYIAGSFDSIQMV